MTCYRVKRQSISYVDGTLRKSDHARIASHLRQCESCAARHEQVTALRSTLKSLPEPKAPSRLDDALRIMASRERKAMQINRGSRFQALWARWKFEFDMMMRPVTIPATGGILSSVVLFGVLSLAISTTSRVVAYEVPVSYLEQINANLVPVELRSREVVLTMNVDSHGHVHDYEVGDGLASFTGDAANLQFNNNISLPKFPSVLALAQPVTGDVRISFTPLGLRP